MSHEAFDLSSVFKMEAVGAYLNVSNERGEKHQARHDQNEAEERLGEIIGVRERVAERAAQEIREIDRSEMRGVLQLACIELCSGPVPCEILWILYIPSTLE